MGRIVLASASRARASMLEAAGVAVDCMPAAIDEHAIREALLAESVDAVEGATILAEMKGKAVLQRLAEGGAIVLACDQLLVTEDGRWLDKPGGVDHARAQLLDLSGHVHSLVSSVVGFRGGERIWHHVDEARLWMRPLSEAFIDGYLNDAGDSVLQSVGCYHLEGRGAQLMTRIEGDFFTILGMPLLPVLQFLRDQGILAR